MDKILILDFGSQYTQLIARRIRELKVYCEIWPCHSPVSKVREFAPSALILSGGPSSVYDSEAPKADPELLKLNIPTLGICYGMQWLSNNLKGKVEPGKTREYGPAQIKIQTTTPLFQGFDCLPVKVWMSHGDHVTALPSGFQKVADSENGVLAAIGNVERKMYGLQFHPEVQHTPRGREILSNFLFGVAQVKPDWTMTSFVDLQIDAIRKLVGEGHVICGVSGGVDSTVMATLIHKAVGDRLTAIFVDNGVLRKNEARKVLELFQDKLHIPVRGVDASERFLKRLAGIADPEKKRKIIGTEFIAVFEEEAGKISHADFLGQGTLYPDVIESVSVKGPSAVIKSHHNVGGLPERMKLKLVEPLRELFKDEVRELGLLLGLPEELIRRQPFPGPGLAVRILGEVTQERCDILREADDIVVSEIKAAGWYNKVWQSFAVLLPVKTVGVMGDNRTYENVVALRVVDSQDGMTADWVSLPYELLGKISNRIINEVRGVNRVVYDISSKPPATIEWE